MPVPLVIMVGADKGGVGKSQPLTSKILTPSGWRLMADMKLGTPICGIDGKTYQVRGVFPQGKQRKFIVHFTDGTKAECSPDHLWTTRHVTNARRRDEGWVTRTADQLRKMSLRAGDYFYYRIPTTEAIEFASQTMPIDPYVLGVVIGDGWLSGNEVVCSVPPTKEPVRQKVAANVEPGYRVNDIKNSSDSCPRFSITRSDDSRDTMHKRIRDLGLNIKSKERFIPEIYKLASIPERLELLRGLMDTDGSSQDGRTSFHTCSDRLAQDVADLVRSLGGIAIVHNYNRDHEGKALEWKINVRLNECPFSLDYKIAGWKPAGQLRGKYIAAIEEDGVEEMQCISTTAPNSLYITDGYNATHNTLTCRLLADYFQWRGIRYRAIDTEHPAGGFVRFLPSAEIIDIEKIEGQMRAFDAMHGVTLIDVRAGLLSGILDMLDRAQILQDVKAGNMRLALLHVLGPSVQSLREVSEAAQAIGGGARHFLVKNYISEMTTWESATKYASTLAKMANVTITLPHLIDHAAETIDTKGVSFVSFAQDGGGSKTLRGYTRTWLENAWAEIDRVGIGAMCKEADLAA